jgi:hypothetical protein
MIYFYSATSNNYIVNRYRELLSPSLKQRYESIIKERRDISLKGYVLGFLISLLVIAIYKYKCKNKCIKKNTFFICMIVSISFLTNYFYYILTPKSDWMLNHLKSREEISMWLEVYKEMQRNYHMGILLGIIGVAFLGVGLGCG